ncbi:MAG: saccharopine dehydrogenase NADP-binding domain-containing protein [Chitinophagales bacterium]|nr:saccharopine dehydrogenase NADP-binding domain-containing protein [Chitinophagales bacterium]
MHQILLLGAGKSATVLIDYLLENASRENWFLTLADMNLEAAKNKLGSSPHGKAVAIDIQQPEERNKFIAASDIVISLLPPTLHQLAALSCVEMGKHLLTASYVDESIQKLANVIEQKGLLFLCEMGLDPGIDHMSAMKIIDGIHAKGGKVNRFLSHCGGLVAPESDDNPWHYKISWNPRNIILAGSAGAVYKENNQETRKPYTQVFESCPAISVPGLPALAWYPNRDSLAYIPLYHLEEAHTFIRTTLRYKSFCEAWQGIVAAGLTSVVDKVEPGTTYKDWSSGLSKVQKENHFEAYSFLGLFDDRKIEPPVRDSATILQELTEQKLILSPSDKDMIVMIHELEYEINNQPYQLTSHLVVKGRDHLRTAMAKTVGLPLGIAAKFILNGTIRSKGLKIPTESAIYLPVLKELEKEGICFEEKQETISY